MDSDRPEKSTTLFKRIHGEIVDDLDEEMELEIDDERVAEMMDEVADHPELETLDRKFYFKELLRLQRELIKLQDWVVDKKLKIVVLFEGRDSAGKGGVIKRITQRLNPRVCRVAALPAPSARERSQWYFQRYAAHLPGGGEIVLFDRSWYNRAGVERVMGFCADAEYEEFFQSAPEFERMLVRSGIVLLKYWFSITDEEQNLRFLMRIHDPLKQWKLSPMDLEVAPALGAVHQGQGDDVREDPHPRGALACRRGHRQEARAPQLHRPSPHADSLPGSPAREPRAARARARPALPPRDDPEGNVRAGPLCRDGGQGVSSGVAPGNPLPVLTGV